MGTGREHACLFMAGRVEPFPEQLQFTLSQQLWHNSMSLSISEASHDTPMSP